jgi:hypothetical protein
MAKKLKGSQGQGLPQLKKKMMENNYTGIDPR